MKTKIVATRETDNLKMLRDLQAEGRAELPLLVAIPKAHPNDQHPGGKIESKPPPG
ncbi:MAG TPA: hypothetical protein VLI54_06995 [Bacillota bacterium]|nr:hypothetical protein [Bacillota bacterium]